MTEDIRPFLQQIKNRSFDICILSRASGEIERLIHDCDTVADDLSGYQEQSMHVAVAMLKDVRDRIGSAYSAVREERTRLEGDLWREVHDPDAENKEEEYE